MEGRGQLPPQGGSQGVSPHRLPSPLPLKPPPGKQRECEASAIVDGFVLCKLLLEWGLPFPP